MAVKRQYFEDNRDTIGKLRRTHLNAILDAEGIEHPPSMPANSARELIRSMDIDVERYIQHTQDGPAFLWPEKKANTDVENMKRADLVKMASNLGIQGAFKMKNAELKQSIREKMDGDAS